MNEAKSFLVFLAIALCMDATGKNLSVPGDYASIQAAIDAAAPGDSIEVGPGTYEETLLFKAGIELKGAGPDFTIVRTAAANGEVLKIVDAASGTISGFKFEHSDVESLDPNRKEWPDAVDVRNSSVEIRNCILGPSAGCGIILYEKSNSRVVECRAEGNSQTGIYVRGEGTEATLLHNACNNNLWGGIAFAKGAKAVAEENTCLKNNRWGIRVLHRGTSMVLKNNTFKGNTGPGIVIEKWANGTVEGNVSGENENNGIVFKLGATGAIVGNTCEKNAWTGIVVQSLGADIEVRDNTCADNGNNGITICLGAGGKVIRNICRGNTSNGIHVSSWLTNPVVEKNECTENAMHGISFTCGAAGKAEGNTCRQNKMHGILARDEKTEPDIGQNTYEENGGEEVAREAGDPASRQYQVEPEEIGCALAEEHFDALEKMASLLRQHKCRYAGGGWQLSSFYGGLQKGCDDISPDQREAFAALLERWKQAYPESVVPFITQAEVHVAYGWDARGDGYADTVTDEGWKVLRKELDIAKSVVLEAEALNTNDPHFYTTMIKVFMAKDCSTEELQALFEKGAAIDVEYFPLYYARAWSLAHRWGGRPGELENFAERAFTLTRKEYGHSFYALIAGSMAITLGEEDFVEDHFFDWDKIDKGCSELVEAFPESGYYLNQYCLMACLYQDQEKAVNLFNKIGRNPDQSVWHGTARFNRWKQWAFDMTPAPYPKAYDRKTNSFLNIPVISFLRIPAIQSLCRIALIGGATVVAIIIGTVLLARGYARRKGRRLSQLHQSPPSDENVEDDRSDE